MHANAVIWVKRADIKTHHDFALFPVGQAECKAIAASMRKQGFDPAQPLVRWQETGYLVDGHTRLAAAEDAGETLVPVLDHSFEDWDAALEYAMSRQRDRRNLSKQQLASFLGHVVRSSDRLKQRGGDHKSTGAQESKAPIGAFDRGKSAGELGAKVGVSGRQIERVRAVLASEDEEVKGQLLGGQLTINTAYQQVKQAERAKAESAPIEPPQAPKPPAPIEAASPAPQLALFQPAPGPKPVLASFSLAEWAETDAEVRAEVIRVGRGTQSALNKQDTDNIEWAKWSWNPVSGCLHNCPYCYARDIANRFYTQKFAPTFFPQRLGAPLHHRVPAQSEKELGYRNIFTCSMADLFGKWVPAEWIQAVLDVVRDCPQWNFLFLTKFPNRLAEFTYPQNAWLGTSVDCQARVKNAERAFARVEGGIKWLSIEPMLEPLKFDSLGMFDWVVIGGASKSTETPEWIPPRRWVLDLECQARDARCMIYEKTNLGVQGPSRFREYPGWERPEPTLPPKLQYLPSIG